MEERYQSKVPLGVLLGAELLGGAQKLGGPVGGMEES